MQQAVEGRPYVAVEASQSDVASSLIGQELIDVSLLRSESTSRREDAHCLGHRGLHFTLLEAIGNDEECSKSDRHALFKNKRMEIKYNIIIIIIIWFGDTVTVTHLTKCNTYSKVRAMSA